MHVGKSPNKNQKISMNLIEHKIIRFTHCDIYKTLANLNSNKKDLNDFCYIILLENTSYTDKKRSVRLTSGNRNSI